jgi:hypothetical protein
MASPSSEVYTVTIGRIRSNGIRIVTKFFTRALFEKGRSNKERFVRMKSRSEPYPDARLAIKQFGCYTSIVTRRPSTEPPDVYAASSG